MRGAFAHWYTCLGESAFAARLGICELFARVDRKMADNLKSLKMPTMDTSFYKASFLRGIACRAETYHVIDNYQLIDCDIPRKLIDVFSMHGTPHLHRIFLTQQMQTGHRPMAQNNIRKIQASAFFFDREGTDSLFRMEGICLAE